MRLFQVLNKNIELESRAYSGDCYAVRYKALVEKHRHSLVKLNLQGFFIKHGNRNRLLPSFRQISLILFSGLIENLTTSDSVSNPVVQNLSTTNNFRFLSSNHLYSSTALVNLKLGLVIKYTKLSKRVRKNLRGKQRYKAYLVLLNDKKTQGSIIRLYNLLSLTLSETRDYESYADLSLFYSELFFSQLSYDMMYTQIQKLMLQSYVENGGRAVVPNILDLS